MLSSVSTTHAGNSETISAVSSPSRYGLFNLLDHRSTYGSGAFPEPFLNDDSDLEESEFRLDWMQTGATRLQNDEFTAEFEKGFGPVTLEAELHFERGWAGGEGVTQGIGNIDLGARVPFFQYVSPSSFFDTTFGAGVEFGIPVHSDVSRAAEFVPKVFNDTKIGDHFTLQSIVGFSTTFGSQPDFNEKVLEYGFTAGWTFQHKELPIPGVQQFVPVFELAGEKALNKEEEGANNILGMIGFRANLKAIGPVQPRVGAGYVFPMNHVAHEEVHNGVVVSFVFEF